MRLVNYCPINLTQLKSRYIKNKTEETLNNVKVPRSEFKVQGIYLSFSTGTEQNLSPRSQICLNNKIYQNTIGQTTK